MILKSSIWKNFTCAMFLSFRFFSCRDFLLNYSQRNIPENSKNEDVTLISSRVGDVISDVWLSLIDQSGDHLESWSRRSFSIIFLAIVFFSKKTLQSLLFMGNLGILTTKKLWSLKGWSDANWKHTLCPIIDELLDASLSF